MPDHPIQGGSDTPPGKPREPRSLRPDSHHAALTLMGHDAALVLVSALELIDVKLDAAKHATPTERPRHDAERAEVRALVDQLGVSGDAVSVVGRPELLAEVIHDAVTHVNERVAATLDQHSIERREFTRLRAHAAAVVRLVDHLAHVHDISASPSSDRARNE